ncbi:MAG: VanZ family protein [Pseudomonadota bacterium]
MRQHITLCIFATAFVGLAVAVLALAPLSLGGANGSDKLFHFLVFATLAAPLPMARPRLLLPVVLAAIAYGGLLEILQPFTGRSAEWLDFGANGFGAVAGAALGAMISLARASRQPVSDP